MPTHARATRKNLPLWARILFETPELVTEIITNTYNRTKTDPYDNIHAKSLALTWIDDELIEKNLN